MLYLALGFIGSSSLAFAVFYGFGAVYGDRLPVAARWSAAAALCAVCVLVDVAVVWTGRMYSLGPRRQTPRRAVYQLGDRMGAFVWGIDTGLVVTTFRTSAATWAALGLALLNVAPAWSGLAYGAGFVVPLTLAVLSPARRAETDESSGLDGSRLPLLLARHRRTVQLAGLVLAAAGAAGFVVRLAGVS